MIIDLKNKIIFIKTKKTAGTSMEIALSKFCGKACVITPISPKDEVLRKRLGYRGPQNFYLENFSTINQKNINLFYNHISANEVQKLISPYLWDECKKIAIVRNPFDVAISRYYWEGGDSLGISFLQYLKNNPKHLRENAHILSLKKGKVLDCYLRYENLEADLRKNNLLHVWQVFKQIRAKSNIRPGNGATTEEMYRRFPRAIEIIIEECYEEMKVFGYMPPSL